MAYLKNVANEKPAGAAGVMKRDPPETGLLFTIAQQAWALSDDGNGGDSPPVAASGQSLNTLRLALCRAAAALFI
jgi:hypothetical protein